MNKNTIVEFKTKDIEGLFVSVPYQYKNFKIEQYSRAGTYLVETDSKELNHWKVKIPKGYYEVIGRSDELESELIESKIGVSFEDYTAILDEKDIRVNYSDYSNVWAVLVVNTRYLCECGKVQPREEMRREYDFGYDQLCCTKCGDVLIDDLHGVVHCTVS